MNRTLLIIGAGPYGVAIAAIAKHLGIDFAIVGNPFELWHRHTPPGMLLRSSLDWHIDPLEDHTIQRYLHEYAEDAAAVEPLSREVLLRYFQWFTLKKRIEIISTLVRHLDRVNDGFLATLDGGQTITSKIVVAAPGFASFPSCPANLTSLLPPGWFSHTVEAVDFSSLKDRCCLIVGGRQSAFEWAALIAEAGARAVHVTYPHPTPKFALSDWSWVKGCLDLTVANPQWFRTLSSVEREALEQRFWTEGRLKLEPWLEDRIRRPEISLHPDSLVMGCRHLDGRLRIELSDDTCVVVDHVILATGYRMDLERVEFLKRSPLREAVETELGYPLLDQHFQSRVPGLFFAGFPTTRDFGPFFGFLVGAPATAKVIGGYLAHQSYRRAIHAEPSRE